ncbi:MAG: twin-arginine translocase subunit TatC [Acidimicrobiales bacterium]|nr:twin-arginine translocase subunit TatC [Acidimicrobiales bacterium]
MTLLNRRGPRNEVDPEGHMPLREHIAELRRRILVSALAVFAGAVICFWQFPAILDVLSAPYCELRPTDECEFLQTDPLEAFTVRLTVAFYGGIALAMPVLLLQLWKFVTPGLHPNERRYALPFVGSAAALFVMGAGLAFLTVPRALNFLTAIGGDWFEPFFRGSEYLAFLVKMMVAFGVGFEFPIVLIFLQLAGIVTPEQLGGLRRYSLVGIMLAVAIITPSGDPFSLFVLSVPMYLFYEASILIGRFLRR